MQKKNVKEKKNPRLGSPTISAVAGPSESHQDTVSLEMTLSLGNGFLLLRKCPVSVGLVMTLLLIFFGGNDYFYFCAVFLTVLPYSEDKLQLCVLANHRFETVVNLARPRASSLEGGSEHAQTCSRALSPMYSRTPAWLQ